MSKWTLDVQKRGETYHENAPAFSVNASLRHLILLCCNSENVPRECDRILGG